MFCEIYERIFMNNIYLFAISLGAGFLSSFCSMKLIIRNKKKLKKKENEELKNEVIEGLHKLK